MSRVKALDQIVVLAPRYPSVNQAWMDNYLNQLLRNKTDVLVVSEKSQANNLNEKNECEVVNFPSIQSRSFLNIIKSCAFNPGLIKDIKSAIRDSSVATGFLKVYLWLSLVRSVHLPTDRRLLIHSHSETFSLPFAYFAAANGIPFVLTFHGFRPSGVPQLSNDRRKGLYRRCSKIIVNTEYAKGVVCELGAAPSQVIVLPQGIPVERFEFRPLASPAMEGSLRILTVGRIHKEKGLQYALLSAARLKAAGIKFLWTFVGEGDHTKKFVKFVEKLGLDDCVKMIAQVPNIQLSQVYQDNHIFVLPSISSSSGCDETQGVVLQEAQASGCIPIATKIGGIPEVIESGVDGILIPERSSKALTLSIQYLLDHPETWQAYHVKGRRKVEEHFSSDVIGHRMSGVLNQVFEDFSGQD